MIKEIRSELMSITASLLRNIPSTFEEDYPKTMPKKVLRELQQHDEYIKVQSRKLVSIINKLKEVQDGETTK